MQGVANLDGSGVVRSDEDQIGRNEDYKRIAILASSLKREELLELDAETILRRLFWEEDVRRFEPLAGEQGPKFACTCSHERVSSMLRSPGPRRGGIHPGRAGPGGGGLRVLRRASTGLTRWTRRRCFCSR
jgi:hypothetical protein